MKVFFFHLPTKRGPKLILFENKYKLKYIYVVGKTPQLYRHDLLALQSKQSHRFSMHMNRIPERLVPRKFALTTKVPDTKGCTKCCVGRNPYNGYKYLCGAMLTGIFLMQWYDPLNKFMLLKVSELQLP